MRFKIKSNTFYIAMQWLYACTAKEDNRPVLTGIQFKFDGNTLNLYSADGYACHKYTVSKDDLHIAPDTDPFEFILDCCGVVIDSTFIEGEAIPYARYEGDSSVKLHPLGNENGYHDIFKKNKKEYYVFKYSLELLFKAIAKDHLEDNHWIDFNIDKNTADIYLSYIQWSNVDKAYLFKAIDKNYPMILIEGHFPDCERALNIREEYVKKGSVKSFLSFTHDALDTKAHKPSLVDWLKIRVANKNVKENCIHLISDGSSGVGILGKTDVGSFCDTLEFDSLSFEGKTDVHLNIQLLYNALKTYEMVYWSIEFISNEDPVKCSFGNYLAVIMPMQVGK